MDYNLYIANMLSLHILLSLITVSTVLADTTSLQSNVRDVENDLRQRLSADAQISTNVSLAPRWSDYHAPQYQYMVHVAEEQDVAETVFLSLPAQARSTYNAAGQIL